MERIVCSVRSTGTPRYRGTTRVTRWPRRASACGRAPATSASPPVLANGCASDETMKMRSGPASTGGAAAIFALGALFGALFGAVFAGVLLRVGGAGGVGAFGDSEGGRFFGGIYRTNLS